MYLSDNEIRQAIESGELFIENFDPSRLGTVSYDLLLGNRFLITDLNKTTMIDPASGLLPRMQEVVVEDGQEFILQPHQSVLAHVNETVGTKSNILIQLSGKSSLARIGLTVHNTAGIVNPGHYLKIVLELTNLNSVPIILRPKMQIAHFLFARLSSAPTQMYDKIGNYAKDNWKVTGVGNSYAV
jgi:dCTP deaminase